MTLSRGLALSTVTASTLVLVASVFFMRDRSEPFVSPMASLLEPAPVLYGGRPIKTGELTPSVYIGNCTATVVGPEVILTAGHCRSSGTSVSFVKDRVKHSGKCVRHPDYSRNGWLNNDWSLCKVSPRVELDVYGTISSVALEVGDEVTMQGYGKGSNGKLNVGYAKIKTKNYMDYITKGSVYLGGGDSGGALFSKITDLVKGPFPIVGVNSRGGGNQSYFNISSLERSQTFFRDYAKKNSVDICGVNKECGEPENVDCPEEFDLVRYFEEELNRAKDMLYQCTRAL